MDILFSIHRHVLYCRVADKHLCSGHSGSGFLLLDCHIQARGEIKISALCAIYFCLITLSQRKSGKFNANFHNSRVFNLTLGL